jgi:hypothetical protein
VEEPEEADGTHFGGPTLPPQDEWVTNVTSWWTGPWPVLHSRIEESNQENASIVAQAKCNLLGQLTMETFDVTDDDDNELSDVGENISDIATQLLIDKWIVTAGLLAVEFIWQAACYASYYVPGWIFVAMALGLDWFFLYTYLLMILEATLRNSGFPAAIRFWVLLVAGAVLGFGSLLLVFGVPVLGAMLAAQDVTKALDRCLPGGYVTVFFKLLALVSLTFIIFGTLQYD